LGLPDNELLLQKTNNGGRMNDHEDKASHYRKNSLTLIGAVALPLGTGVMIGATVLDSWPS
jgi:hypothetical protein